MLLREVIGQERLKSHLIEMVRAERVPHAQLFLEKSGAGGLPLALALAQLMLCENPGEEDACGTCSSCVKASKLIHPDLHFTYPVITKKPGKPPISADYINEWRNAIQENPYFDKFDWLKKINAENKQGNITAQECRRVITQLQLKSFEGKHKILIIWGAEELKKEGNILLKLIEEPPPQTKIVLIAQNQDLLLNTITSRTQILNINRIDDDSIKEGLVSKGNSLSNEGIAKIVHFSEGDFNRALKLLQKQTPEMSEHLNTWLIASMNNQAANLIEWIQQITSNGREFLKQFFEYLLFFFRECLLLSASTNYKPRLTLKEKELAIRVSKFYSVERLEKINKLLSESYYQIERNGNGKIVLLDTSIKVSKILRGKKLALIN